jgi:hypothetical protein
LLKTVGDSVVCQLQGPHAKFLSVDRKTVPKSPPLFTAKPLPTICYTPKEPGMSTHADKKQENNSKAPAAEVSQKQSGGTATFQFAGSHPQASAQRKLQEMANNSSQVKQLRAFQEIANSSPQVKRVAHLQAVADSFSAQQQQAAREKENSTGLPDNLKTGIENLSGYAMDDVKVHYNSDKAAPLQAHAFAQGTAIHIAPGQEKHLPHEAWHVVQQKKGGVKPTKQLKGGVPINDEEGLEREADVQGAKALQFYSYAAAQQNPLPVKSPSVLSQTVNALIQREEWEGDYFQYVGFKFGDLMRVSRKQHTPETCWAAGLAMSAALLGKADWNNEIKWFNTAKAAGLVMENSTRILPDNLYALVQGISGFSISFYSMGGLAGVIGSTLKNNQVILLMAEQHVVIIGQLQLEKSSGAMQFHVIDSAVGSAETWSQAQFNAFAPVAAFVIA